jgi:hypothetical protein
MCQSDLVRHLGLLHVVPFQGVGASAQRPHQRFVEDVVFAVHGAITRELSVSSVIRPPRPAEARLIALMSAVDR